MVRFAPLLAIGMYVAYFCGSLSSTIVIGCSAAVFVFLVIKKNPFSVNVAGLLCGTLVMFLFVQFRVAPVMRFADTSTTADIVVEEVIGGSEGGQTIIAKTKLDGVTAKVRLFCREHLAEGQSAAVEITFMENDEEWELYNLSRGIFLTGTAQVISVGIMPESKNAVSLIRSLREGLAGIVREYFPDDSGLLALSMLFGMDEDLPDYISEQLCVCGASHFTAVSGTHFSVFAAIFLCGIPKSAFRRRTVGVLLLVPIAILFFGAGNSVLRAAVMFLIYGLQEFFGRESDTLNSLCVAVTVICLISPAAVLDIGFAMSVFGAFGAGVVGIKSADRLCSILPQKAQVCVNFIRPLLVSLGACICTAPLSVAVFGGASLVGVFTTCLITPLVSLAMLLTLLLGVTGFGVLSVPLGLIIKFMNFVVSTIGGIRSFWLSMNFNGAVVISVIAALVFVILSLGSWRLFETAAVCMAALLVFSLSLATFVRNNRSEAVIVSDGSSSAQLIIHGREAVVIVSGNGGELADVLPQTFRQNGVLKVIDFSAHQADYCGAVMLKDMYERYQIENISTNDFALGVFEAIP